MNDTMKKIEQIMNSIIYHKKEIKALEEQLQKVIKEGCNLEIEPTKNIIVSIKFPSNKNKTYDYQLIDKDVNVAIGDLVFVETPWNEIKEVEVVDYYENSKERNLAPASYSQERLIEFCNEI